VNICYVLVGDISFEIKTEADSKDTTEYSHDDMPSTGMIVFSSFECILCTMFALVFVVLHQQKYVSIHLSMCRATCKGSA